MPGLIGIVQRVPDRELEPLFQTLSAPMHRTARWRSEYSVDPLGRWALGRIHLGILQPDAQLAGDDSVKALFHGDLYNAGQLGEALDDSPTALRAPAGLLGALYRREGTGFIPRLAGSFCLVILDLQESRLVLASDRLGSYPLYWWNSPERFVFASELRALLRDPSIRAVLDPRAVADYLTFGFPLGDKTLAQGVRLLPSGATLTYSWRDATVRIEKYHDWAAAFVPWQGSKADYLQQLTTAFRSAVERDIGGPHRFGISLSGGLDSRTILSAVDSKRHPISSFTLGIQGCADQVIAQKLAGLAGTQHHFFQLDDRYLVDFLPNLEKMVSLSDGMYLSHGLTEILALRFLEETGTEVLIRGHGAELAKTALAWPLHTDERVYQMERVNEFIPYLLARVNYISRGVALDDVLTNEWSELVRGGARQSLEEVLDNVPLAPANCCSYLYLTEHHRRFTVASLELFRNVLEVRLPFVDTEFLALLFRAPPRWREHTQIHRALIAANHAALLRVRNSNTGAAADAGPLREAVLDKFNTLFKRWNVPGYRHYHNFDAWMQRMLIQSVEQVILAPEAVARGIFRETALRALVEQTRQGTIKGAYLLQVLLILELWQRANGVTAHEPDKRSTVCA
jgi:asparagine synthase (glutamine-hydrolysing)